MKKDLISIYDLNKKEIEDILDTAIKIKKAYRAGKKNKILEGKILGLIFHKPSTRTRLSFDAGMKQLGGQTIFVDVASSQLSRGETVADTAKIMSKYLSGVVIRGDHKFLAEFAANASIPVINGLTELTHPCQILADLLTIKEEGKKFNKLKLVFVGDGNNVCNSLMFASGKLGINFVASCPKDYNPDKEVIKKAISDAKKSGGSIELIEDPFEAAKNADVLYTDTWISMGQEEEEKKRLQIFKKYQINNELLKVASKNAIVLHCLPAHRGQEITSDVMDGKQSAVWDEAENRLHAQKAVLAIWLKR